jgi:hypothetical protein
MQRGDTARESQKAKGKTQKSKVKGRASKTYGERANQRGALI